MDAIDSLKNIKTGETSSFNVDAWIQKCYDAMNDDFNTPILIANLFSFGYNHNPGPCNNGYFIAPDEVFKKSELPL